MAASVRYGRDVAEQMALPREWIVPIVATILISALLALEGASSVASKAGRDRDRLRHPVALVVLLATVIGMLSSWAMVLTVTLDKFSVPLVGSIWSYEAFTAVIATLVAALAGPRSSGCHSVLLGLKMGFGAASAILIMRPHENSYYLTLAGWCGVMVAASTALNHSNLKKAWSSLKGLGELARSIVGT